MASWSERELEDWLCEHVQDFFGEAYTLLGRQVPLPDGKIMDMLLWNQRYASLAIVELKSVVADGEALAQLMCYQHLLTATIERDEFYQPLHEAVPDEKKSFWRMHVDPEGFLVAPDFSEYVKVGVAQAHGVQLRFAAMHWRARLLRDEWVDEKVNGQCPDALAGKLALHTAAVAAKYAREVVNDAECPLGEDHDRDLHQPEHCGLES